MASRLYGSNLHGIALGLLSTAAGLAFAELAAGLVRGSASPVIPVGQEVIDRVPPAVEKWAIDWFGTADKAVLIIGTLLVLGLIGSVVGILAVRGARAVAYVVTALVGLIGMLAVALRPAPDVGKLLPPIVGTIVTIGVLWWLSPRAAHSSEGEPAAERSIGHPGDTRRGFLLGAATVGLASVVAGSLGRALKGRFSVDDERAVLDIPDPGDTLPGVPGASNPADTVVVQVDPAPEVVGADFRVEGLTPYLVPNGDFYRIDTALVVPQVSKDDWSLRVHGMVDRELRIGFADLLSRPMIERDITLSCVSNPVGGDLVGNARWQGVPMRDVLNEAGVHDGATQIVSRSIDGWTCGSPTSVIMDGRDAMLAIAMNGEPLPPEHGYPVRLVVPGLYGYVSATKWVTEIELTRWEDFDGYWVPRGWAKEGPVKTMARIDRPRGGSTSPDADGVVDIAGVAWAVHRGLSRVEVSIDDGEWLDCELAGVPSDDTWRQWRLRWTGADPGEHTVTARAYDGGGAPQPLGPKDVAPDGAEGYHQVRFVIEN